MNSRHSRLMRLQARRFRNCVLLGVFVQCAVAGRDVSAGDVHVYPGAVCVPTNPSNNMSSYVLNWGEFRYDMTSDLYSGSIDVACPVLHDQTSDGSYDVEVWVYDAVAANISCTAYSIGFSSPSFLDSETGTSNVSGARDNINLSVSDANTASVYHVKCTLPTGQSGSRNYITSILVDE